VSHDTSSRMSSGAGRTLGSKTSSTVAGYDCLQASKAYADCRSTKGGHAFSVCDMVHMADLLLCLDA
jgi:hypothetical protein